jgi:hypothetical protein
MPPTTAVGSSSRMLAPERAAVIAAAQPAGVALATTTS